MLTPVPTFNLTQHLSPTEFRPAKVTVVETGHKNLTFLKTVQSAKVRRWQLALQEFDFKYIHIKGEDNVVADAFSRLCDHLPMDGVVKTERLTAIFISGGSVGSNAPTIEPRSN
jgi:hypothetical protein